MRQFPLSLCLSAAVLLPNVGNAQVYRLPTQPPQVTAASASWQLNGEPVFYAGAFYYPAGASVYFDGNVMTRVGVHNTVPLYVDATLEPYSIVFVPIGGNVMRPYERKRTGELAGTVGSRAPSFPIERDVEVSATRGLQTPPRLMSEPQVIAEEPRPVGTMGTVASTPARSRMAAPLTERPRPRRTIMESIPAPRSNAGIWIEYQGARYRSAGAAVSYAPGRFAQVGEYHGFPVYQDRNGNAGEIFVSAMQDGPLVPYRR